MRNVIDALATHDTQLVFFDNTHIYPRTAEPQTEDTSFRPHGETGRVRAPIARRLLSVIERGRVDAFVAHAPEFNRHGKLQSITNSAIVKRLMSGMTVRVFLRDDTVQSLNPHSRCQPRDVVCFQIRSTLHRADLRPVQALVMRFSSTAPKPAVSRPVSTQGGRPVRAGATSPGPFDGACNFFETQPDYLSGFARL